MERIQKLPKKNNEIYSTHFIIVILVETRFGILAVTYAIFQNLIVRKNKCVLNQKNM